LNKYNIQTVFKPPEKIRQILKNPKNQRPPLSSADYTKYLASVEKYTLEKSEE